MKVSSKQEDREEEEHSSDEEDEDTPDTAQRRYVSSQLELSLSSLSAVDMTIFSESF